MSPEQRSNGKELSKVLGILALIGGFTAIFLPMRTYVETQTKMQEEDAKLRAELEAVKSRLSVAETKLQVFQAWPPPVTK